MRALAGPMFYPTIPMMATVNNFSFAGQTTLDAAGEKWGVGFHAPKAGTLAKVGFRLSTVTTGQPLRVSFQDADLTTGLPDGVADQYRVVSVADTDDNLWKLTGIMTSDGTDGGTKRTVTKGQRLCVVGEFDSAVGNLAITNWNIPTPQGFCNSCFVMEFFAGPWGKQSFRGVLVYLEYDDGSSAVIEGSWPATSAANHFFGNTQEVGLRCTVPFRCNVEGVWAYLRFDATGGTAEVRLYDSALTLLASGSVDGDLTLASPLTQSVGEWMFSSAATLEPNTVYYVVVRCTSAVSMRLLDVQVDSASILNAWDGGSAIHEASRTDVGSFTLRSTWRPMIGLRISGLEDGMGNAKADGTFAGSGPELR